ncbi:hypothetical protein ACFWFX_15435 [Streptomyces roseolus]|uniref:hypothetical protein n=1 Tax=Streptomyces roseolus TaxID=67358 RepID=UPI00364AF3D6
MSTRPTPVVHPVPGGFVVATPLPVGGTVLIEGFFLGTDERTGAPVSQPLVYWEMSAEEVDAKIAEFSSDIVEYLAQEDRYRAERAERERLTLL